LFRWRQKKAKVFLLKCTKKKEREKGGKGRQKKKPHLLRRKKGKRGGTFPLAETQTIETPEKIKERKKNVPTQGGKKKKKRVRAAKRASPPRVRTLFNSRREKGGGKWDQGRFQPRKKEKGKRPH